MLPVSNLAFESLVIHSGIFAGEVVKEVFEEMLNVSVGALNGVMVGTQVLI
jgi:hypothetical protein